MAGKRIAYLIPEFPGQTHIWMWREITHLREWGNDIQIFSTRRPSERDRARHAFVEEASIETVYLWPHSLISQLRQIGWALATRPIGFIRCIVMGLSIPIVPRQSWWRRVGLVIPALTLAWHVKRSNTTHLHAQSARSCAILCMMVRRLTGVSYSLVVNARLDEWGGALQEKFREASFVVTHARWLSEEIQTKFRELDPGRVVWAPVGVDTRVWSPVKDREPGFGRAIRLVSVGRLHANKGFDLLIRSVAELVQSGTDVVLSIVGSGPARGLLEALIHTLGLHERVTLTGSLPEHEVRSQLQRADIFALPSREEALGVALMEAMATGLPVVAARVGGVGEVVQDGVNGLMVPPDDIPSLVRALRCLCCDSDLRQSLGEAGRRWIEARFDSRKGASILLQRLSATP